MIDDPEVTAMGEVASAIDSLDEDQQRRVLDWAVARFVPDGTRGTPLSREIQSADIRREHEYHKRPSRSFLSGRYPDRLDQVLVVAYWLQKIKGEEAQQVNAELANLGHKIKNITDAFNSLMARSPALAIKSGTSKQARKRYKLTTAGISPSKRYCRILPQRHSLSLPKPSPQPLRPIPDELAGALVADYVTLRQDAAAKTLGRATPGKFESFVRPPIETGQYEKSPSIDQYLRNVESHTAKRWAENLCSTRHARCTACETNATSRIRGN